MLNTILSRIYIIHKRKHILSNVIVFVCYSVTAWWLPCLNDEQYLTNRTVLRRRAWPVNWTVTVEVSLWQGAIHPHVQLNSCVIDERYTKYCPSNGARWRLKLSLRLNNYFQKKLFFLYSYFKALDLYVNNTIESPIELFVFCFGTNDIISLYWINHTRELFKADHWEIYFCKMKAFLFKSK